MMMAITFSRQNDAGSLEQYSVLRESRTRSRARPGTLFSNILWVEYVIAFEESFQQIPPLASLIKYLALLSYY